jgi:hypothetical protein
MIGPPEKRKPAGQGELREVEIQNSNSDTFTERKLSRQAKWRQNHPKQVWAQASLRSALNRGLIVQQPCEDCGDTNAEAHHDDYDKPMCVRWLCRLHHKAVHRQKGGAA